jgi:TolA-binding protein
MYWRHHCAPPACSLLFVLALLTASGESNDRVTFERRYQTAADHYAAGRWESAAIAWQKLAENTSRENRRAVDAMFFLGESLLRLNQPARAYQWFAKSLEAEPRHAHADVARFRLGESAYLMGDFERAEPPLREYAAEVPDGPFVAHACVYLGELSITKKAFASAQEWFNRAMSLTTDPRLLADCRMGIGRACEEASAFDQASDLFQRELEIADSPHRAEALYRLARTAYQQQDFPRAAELFQRQTAPEFGDRFRMESAYWHAMSEAAQSHWDQALRLFEVAAAADETHRLAPAIHWGLAVSLRNLGRNDESAAEFERIGELWPHSSWGDDSLFERVRMAAEANQHALAESLAVRFHADYSGSPLRSSVAQLQARSLLAQGKYAAALLALDQFSDGVAAGWSDEARGWHQYYRALTHAGMGEHETATSLLHELLQAELVDNLRKAVEAAISRQGPDRKQLDQAMDRYLRGDANGARQALQVWLSEFPSSAWRDECLAHLAAISIELNQPDEVETAYSELADSYPASAYWLESARWLALHAGQTRSWERAVQWSEKVLARECPADVGSQMRQLLLQAHGASGNWRDVSARAEEMLTGTSPDELLAARYWLGESQFQSGDFAQALSTWRGGHSDAARPDHPLQRAMQLRQAQCLARLGQWQELQALLDRQEREDPHRRDLAAAPEYLYLRGRCQFQASRFQEARRCFERVVRSVDASRTETAARAQWMIGESWLAEQSYGAAIAAFQRVQFYDFPQWQAAALLREGKCHELLGDWARSIACYARIVAEHPRSSSVEDANTRLATLQSRVARRK